MPYKDIPKKQPHLFEVEPAIYQLDDDRVQGLRTGEITQTEFMRLMKQEDPWELRQGKLHLVTEKENEDRKVMFTNQRRMALKKTGGLTGSAISDDPANFKRAYPEVAIEIDRVMREIKAEACVGCAANQKMIPILEQILKAETQGRDLTMLKNLTPLTLKKLRGGDIDAEVDVAPIEYPPMFTKTVIPKLQEPVDVPVKPDIKNFKKISKLSVTPEDFWAAGPQILAVYPELTEYWEQVMTKANKASCSSCVRKRYKKRILDRIKALDPEGREVAPLTAVLGTRFVRLLTKSEKKGTEAMAAPMPPSDTGNGPRPSCVDCARKHVAQAIVLLGEAQLGYPDHKWLAVGHLAEASEEMLGDYPEIAADIRTARLLVMEEDVSTPDLMDLFPLLGAEVSLFAPGGSRAPQKKLILKNHQSPGDIVMMTAAVRDFKKAFPAYDIDVRTSADPLWENNPYLTPLDESDPDVESIVMNYPLIHRSNEGPHHFINGFRMFLEDHLGLKIPAGPLKGDIHISDEEKGWISQIEQETGKDQPYWVIAAGGKTDYTCKLWDPSRYQAVVDAMNKMGILCVQIGEDDEGHIQQPLENVVNLIGKTDLREFIRVIYHSSGVICPVTFPMVAAIAVEARPDRCLKHRPCVVIAGGREPAQWQAYPGHAFLHTQGKLSCCDQGGCWRSRIIPLGDGDSKDSDLCENPVKLRNGNTIPKCLDMITPKEVLRHVKEYTAGFKASQG